MVRAEPESVLFTIGYEKRTVDELVCLLLDSGIGVLIDVRETPWSHKPGFSKSALQSRLALAGIEYVHLRSAGNPKSFRSKEIAPAESLALYSRHLDENPDILEAFAALVDEYRLKGFAVCILCFEARPEDCHRGILASRWSGITRGRVVHLPKHCGPA